MAWPSSRDAIEKARAFLQECAGSNLPVLLVPDKDADGLCGTMIVYRTLVALGLPKELLFVHFVTKGANVHTSSEREKMEAYAAKFVIVVDQGSRPGGPIVGGNCKTLIIDHHWTNSETDYPSGALVLSAARHPPVATSSTLAFTLCRPLLSASRLREIDYLCAVGTFGDLGTSFAFEPASLWPKNDMQACIRRCTKKALTDAVSLLNAPRRTSTYDVRSAWDALLDTSDSTKKVLANTRLHEARREVNAETSKVARNRPWFSGDGRVALIRVTSGAQVHPVIAQRWASSLKSTKLEIVMCANDGYLAGMTNFSCRIAKCAKDRVTNAGQDINIIETLTTYADREPGLRTSMGDNFARGHKEASGGIVLTEDFERLWKIMLAAQSSEEGSSPKKKRKLDASKHPQKNTLEGWIKRS